MDGLVHLKKNNALQSALMGAVNLLGPVRLSMQIVPKEEHYGAVLSQDGREGSK